MTFNWSVSNPMNPAENLARRHGWRPEHTGGNVYVLRRDNWPTPQHYAWITQQGDTGIPEYPQDPITVGFYLNPDIKRVDNEIGEALHTEDWPSFKLFLENQDDVLLDRLQEHQECARKLKQLGVGKVSNPTRLYRCAHCGSDQVETEAWIDLNTDEIVDSDVAPNPQIWCRDCEKEDTEQLLCPGTYTLTEVLRLKEKNRLAFLTRTLQEGRVTSCPE